MVTKDDLIFVRDFEYRKRQRERVLDRLREKVDVHSVQFDKILTQGGAERDRMAEHAAAVDEAERRFIREDIDDKARYLRIVEDITKLPPREMEIIQLRYLESHSWGWIRKHLHYSEREIFRFHKSALIHLSEY